MEATFESVTVDGALEAVDFLRYSTLMPLVRCKMMLLRRALLFANEWSGIPPGSSKI